ncbi:MAG: cytotoxic translational repressor of toxin-antitoxin stability system [Deltaproteobacteria bacterium]|nr:cytotoxic translational repressor of toxin-antitoxin stability system [Deltaproteobacteria bacterium]
MTWKVTFTRKGAKQAKKLPKEVRQRLVRLLTELETIGPVRGNWKNYSKLEGNKHHCHIKSGKPTYVVCWEVYKSEIKIEVYYAGSHEKAPY